MMPDAKDDLKSFAHLVNVLVPWLDQVVIVGGWAHRLYRLHPLAQPLEYEPLATLDTDIAMPDTLPHHGEGIGARLAANGFTEELLGDMRPPAIHYRLVTGSAGFYAEFLTPLFGSEHKRGKRDATVSIAGISAQKLRHVDLLLSAPWQVEISLATGFPITERCIIQIPNPVAYLVQKILIHDKRESSSRAKDLLYMHDTIEIFANALPQLRSVWMESVRPTLTTKTVRAVESAPTLLFGGINDAIREAARMASGRMLSPAQLQETCEAGLAAILS